MKTNIKKCKYKSCAKEGLRVKENIKPLTFQRPKSVAMLQVQSRS